MLVLELSHRRAARSFWSLTYGGEPPDTKRVDKGSWMRDASGVRFVADGGTLIHAASSPWSTSPPPPRCVPSEFLGPREKADTAEIATAPE